MHVHCPAVVLSVRSHNRPKYIAAIEVSEFRMNPLTYAADERTAMLRACIYRIRPIYDAS